MHPMISGASPVVHHPAIRAHDHSESAIVHSAFEAGLSCGLVALVYAACGSSSKWIIWRVAYGSTIHAVTGQASYIHT
jgi:hypothetical protein